MKYINYANREELDKRDRAIETYLKVVESLYGKEYFSRFATWDEIYEDFNLFISDPENNIEL